MGVRTQGLLVAGTAGRTGFRNDHQVCPVAPAADPVVGEGQSLWPHGTGVDPALDRGNLALGSFGPGGIASSPVLRIAFTRRLPEAFPATKAGPRLPPWSAASRELNRKPPWARSAPWQAKHRCSSDSDGSRRQFGILTVKKRHHCRNCKKQPNHRWVALTKVWRITSFRMFPGSSVPAGLQDVDT